MMKQTSIPALSGCLVQAPGFRAESEELGQLFSEKHLSNSLLVQLRKELWEFIFCRNGVFNQTLINRPAPILLRIRGALFSSCRCHGERR